MQIPETDFVYDIETYINMFSCDITHVATGTRWIFEVSDRINQAAEFMRMIQWLIELKARMFGFNNEGFDWVVVQRLCEIFTVTGTFSAFDAYQIAQEIIEGDRWANNIWPNDRLVVQGDLYKIHHFDNPAKSTSLKKLEINSRSRKVIDLPYSPHENLSNPQKDEIIIYGSHDVAETVKFYLRSLEQIKFRDDLAEKNPGMGDVLNFNDTKIGKKYFEQELEKKNPGSCYHYVNRRKKPRQTPREIITVEDCISEKVSFSHPEFQRVLDLLNNKVLTPVDIDDLGKSNTKGDGESRAETKGVFKNLSANIDGFSFDFGTGGIHGSVEKQIVRSNDEYDLVDVDVASYYPNLAITNRFYPEHLSEAFCDIYLDVYNQRKSFGKKTVENAMLKLALNGVYGDSNNIYSPFYDPKYTMSITINGQLYLCMLAEKLLFGPGKGMTMVQINTDGLTMLVPKSQRPAFNQVCAEWEAATGLELEHVDYKAMYIRDVNSYIAEKTDGSLKRIGAYAYETVLENPYTRERGWHQDHSMLVVRKAAEAAMVHGVDIAEFITTHRDPFDFMLSVKVGRTSRLEIGGNPVQRTCRYYVTTNGEPMTKIMPPLAKKPDVERVQAVKKGWRVTPVNDADSFDWGNVNWLYYIEEARKLVI